ncbi:unnamed protein product [Nippostrongylus brasiliensis]|uniref:Protein-tyrosine sulfotransferase n=1 Tax=Nippostrongylus brasiliensis TaxID=27835 RepID=A0A0N4Y7G1_NIPBR|nr:hypothetical protein Q1695_010767 [Nippostrongylus brasiliensis]VDL75684.1 unnamed protein product [Nippostrongylus brasiliensis]
MNEQYISVGDNYLKVYYEQLVPHPEPQLRTTLEFLNLPWNSSVFHHEQFIGKAISLSNVERSSDQVVKPVNLDALAKWAGEIPQDVIDEMDTIAPMLRQLGYDPNANPANYGQPDELVSQKTDDVHKNDDEWYRKAVQVVNDPARVDKPVKT